MEDILIDGKPIDIGAWILAYHDNVLVGARQWAGGYVDVPAMGYDNSIETAGYLTDGDKVRLEVLDLDGNTYVLNGDIPVWQNNEIFHTGILTDIQIPEAVSILSAYPNPFNPITNIEFGLIEESNVNISIYDVNGRFVELLIDDKFSRGFHNINWNASAYTSGVYFIKAVSGLNSSTQKLILMKY